MWKYETTSRRYVLVGFAFVSVSLVAGVVYGWPALRQQLLREDNSTLTESQLGAAYTVGAWSTQGCRFLTGMARDKFGTRIVASFCMFATATGFLAIALCDPDNVVAIGSSLFVMGLGSGAQLCVQPVASLFPSHAGSILASLSGAFQISGLVFLALTSISSNRTAAFSAFSALLLILTTAALILLPKGVSFALENRSNEESKNESKTNHDDQEIMQTTDTEDKQETTEPNEYEKDSADEKSVSEEDTSTDNPNPTVIQQLLSLEYSLMVLWFSLLITPLQYYIGSIGFQLEDKGDKTGFYADLYTILYGSSAILSPGVGYLADKFGIGIAQAFATTLCAISFYVLASDASLNVTIISLATNGIGRMFVFGMFFAHVGKRLGYKNYGTLAGLGLLLSSLLSLLQYPLISAAAHGHARVVNIICGTVTISTLPYCAWLARKERFENNCREIETESTREGS